MPCARCRDCACKAGWTRFEFSNYYSDKFWEYRREGNTVYTRYGKIGTSGQTTMRQFTYTWDATQYVNEKVHEKLAKGYERV